MAGTDRDRPDADNGVDAGGASAPEPSLVERMWRSAWETPGRVEDETERNVDHPVTGGGRVDAARATGDDAAGDSGALETEGSSEWRRG